MQKSQQHNLHRKVSPPSVACCGIYLLLITLSACGFEPYVAQPIVHNSVIAQDISKSVHNPAFQDYLLAHGYKSLPLSTWQLDDLTYCALFFSPLLNHARAQLRATMAFQESTTSPSTRLDTGVSRSNQANRDISPFALGFSVGIPIETAGKRDIRIENARHLTQIAQLEIAQSAWQVRTTIAQLLQTYLWHKRVYENYQQEITVRQKQIELLQQRLQHGLVAREALIQGTITHQQAQENARLAQQKILETQALLAEQLGLPLHEVATLSLSDTPSNNSFAHESLIASALLNRIDIHIALENYALAEGQLKLEIAKQYPDLQFNPGYAYEFGDSVWSLNLSHIMTWLNKNKLPIALAKSLRTVEASQFERVQSKVMTEVNLADIKYKQAKQAYEIALALSHKQEMFYTTLQQQLQAGEIDQLALVQGQTSLLYTQRAVQDASYAKAMAHIALENALQIPLDKPMLQFSPHHH